MRKTQHVCELKAPLTILGARVEPLDPVFSYVVSIIVSQQHQAPLDLCASLAIVQLVYDVCKILLLLLGQLAAGCVGRLGQLARAQLPDGECTSSRVADRL